MTYIPSPIDTSGVSLDPELLELAELLAKNTHEVWAKERLAQKWEYGPTRNDLTKEHPCLVPYEALPETEQVYDRNTAMETLKAVCAMGYTISRRTEPEGKEG